MALAGHSEAHIPQPWHLAASISATPFWLINGTSYGHIRRQVRQTTHLFPSITETTPPTSKWSFARIVAARPAAACDWAMDSSISLGECASPHKNIPSEAKSTGRSFICASRKNRSAFNVTFSTMEINFHFLGLKE